MFPRKDNLSAPSAGDPGADVYPYVFTTYRLTEHHTAGGMSRWLPYLSELQPEMFCEVSPELAAERGLEPYGWATIISPRAAIEARVLVTDRMTPLIIGGHTVHQIGLPYHWGVGSDAVVSGDAANDLLGVTLDPNVQIQESKVGSCDIQPGRRPQGEDLLRLVAEYQSRAGATIETDNERITDAVREIIDRDTRGGDGPADRTDRPGHRRRLADAKPRKGFFTDTSICIGCKACEVACKEWNHNPRDGDLELLGSSYDNTGALGASTWRHVAFIEQGRERIEEARESGRALIDLGMPAHARRRAATSDVSRHHPAGHPGVPLADVVRRVQALHARRLSGRLPHRRAVPHRVRHGRRAGTTSATGAAPAWPGARSASSSAAVTARYRDDRSAQSDRRPRVSNVGVAQKCTLCYDRLVEDETPACAKTCPTTSIKFGDHDDLVERGQGTGRRTARAGPHRGAPVRRQ